MSDSPARELVQVRRLRLRALVTGTAASGDYEDGPRRLASITIDRAASKREDAHRLTWEDGRSLVYYGGTEVWVQREERDTPT